MRGDKKTKFKQEIGARVRRLRNERDWKQKVLAEMIGAESHSTISEIENGYRMPSQATLYALADVFHVSVGYLLGKPEVDRDGTPETLALKDSMRSALDEMRACLDRAATLLTMIV